MSNAQDRLAKFADKSLREGGVSIDERSPKEKEGDTPFFNKLAKGIACGALALAVLAGGMQVYDSHVQEVQRTEQQADLAQRQYNLDNAQQVEADHNGQFVMNPNCKVTRSGENWGKLECPAKTNVMPLRG